MSLFDYYRHLTSINQPPVVTAEDDTVALTKLNLVEREETFARQCMREHRRKAVTWRAKLLAKSCSCLSRQFSAETFGDRRLAEEAILGFISTFGRKDRKAAVLEVITGNSQLASMDDITAERVFKIAGKAFKSCEKKLKA